MSNEYKEWMEDREQEIKNMRDDLSATIDFLRTKSIDTDDWYTVFEHLNTIMDYFNDQLTIV